MGLAHKGSILPIKHCVPVDKNTTFLAHYDIIEEESLFGIKPIGQKYGVYLDGVSNYISIPHSSLYNFGTGDYTYRIKFKLESTPTGTVQIFCKRDGSGNVELQTDASLKLLVYFGIADNLTSTNTINVGKWYDVVVTRLNGTGYLFVNGELWGSKTSSTSSSGSANINIGRDVAGGSEYANITVSEFCIFNYGFTQDMVKNLIISELTGNETGLVGYWKLNEGSGTTVYDYTNNQNNGTINGGIWSGGECVFTLLPFEGKYGGGIAIEEGTTNLVSSLTASAQNGGNVVGYWSTPITSVTDNTSPTGYSYFVNVNERVTGDPSHSTHGIIIGEATNVGANTTITYSCYVKFNKSGVPFSVQGRAYPNQGEGINSTNYTSTGNWQRVSVTYTTIPNQTTGGFQILVSGSNRNGTTFNVTMIQCEKKPFSTSFVNGTRSSGCLKYPVDCINPQQGTISFWYKPSYPSSYITEQKDSPKLIQVGEYYTNSSFTIWNLTNTLKVFMKGPTSSGWSGAVDTTKPLTQNVWTMITVTWNGTSWKVYKDGVQVGSFTSSEALGSIYGKYIYVGGDGGDGGAWLGKACNGIIDELRIDRIERTAEEIQQWYYSQAPFFPKGIHRIYS